MAVAVAARPASRLSSSGWRACAAVPASVGSALLLVVAFAPLGAWGGLALLAWLCAGAVALTRAGEAVAVRGWCRFRTPDPAQAAALGPAWVEALRRCHVPVGEVNLYVQRAATVNAYAVGGRSVAVTSRAVESVLARRLGHDDLVAVLAHELGHHASGATRFALLTGWLAAPWRLAARTVLTAASAVAGPQPRRLLAVVVAAGLVVAVAQSWQQHRWGAALVLAAVAAGGVLCPLVDAAAARDGEYAADRFAAAAGLGPQLAHALRRLDPVGARGPRRGRFLARHPDIRRRVAALETPDPRG